MLSGIELSVMQEVMKKRRIQGWNNKSCFMGKVNNQRWSPSGNSCTEINLLNSIIPESVN